MASSEMSAWLFGNAVAAVTNPRLLETQDSSVLLLCDYIIIAVLLDKALLKKTDRKLNPAADPQ